MGARCRLCAELREDRVALLEEVQLSAKIQHLFQIQVSLEDKLPTSVCMPCCETVNNIWEFNERVQKAQELLFAGNSDCENQLLQLPTSPEMVECVFAAVKTDEQPQQTKRIPVRKKSTRAKVRRQQQQQHHAKSLKDDDDSDLSGASDAETNEDGSVNLQHNLQGWDQYPWTCCECQQALSSADDLRDHCATIHGHSARFACADCPKVYAKYTMFVGHAKVHRPRLRFCCDACGKWFQTARAQERHRSGHGDERTHACATCGKRFRMQSALLVHARSHLPAELKNRHQCDQCPKRFGTKPNLMAHKRIHAGVRDYTCDQCGKSFVQKGNLDNHLLTHTAARPFPCATCGKTFKTLVRLRKHGSVHSGLKPHQCDVCGRQFRERGTLKEHHRIHTGAMPFTCEFCGKSFRFKGVLTTHRRQHTGERPYSCLECQHHFTNWPNYNKHMKRRHGINTSVTVRKPQTIPPTGMPQRNPPGTVLAPPQPLALPETFNEHPVAPPPFYPVLNLYNLPEELLQQRV